MKSVRGLSATSQSQDKGKEVLIDRLFCSVWRGRGQPFPSEKRRGQIHLWRSEQLQNTCTFFCKWDCFVLFKGHIPFPVKTVNGSLYF